MHKRIIHNLGLLASATLFVLALYIIHNKLHQYHYYDIVNQIVRTPLWFLFLAVLFTFLDYLLLTGYDALALRYIRNPLRYPQVAIASFIGYAFSINTTVLGGSAARYRIYSSLGISAANIARLVIFCSLTFWLGFFAIGALSFLFQPLNISQVPYLPYVSVRAVGAALAVVVLSYLVVISFIRKPLKIRGWEFEAPGLRISLGQIFISSLDWAVAAAVLYVLLPQSLAVTYSQFLGIFLLAQLIGLISSVPGGLGVFESAILLLISEHQDTAGIIGSLLLYRVIYYILPLMFASVLLGFYEFLANRRIVLLVGKLISSFGKVIIPDVFAFGTFIAGAFMLFSGALPAAKGRLEFLSDFLPLSAIEISHFLSSIIGAALLILARGLQRHIDTAYHITVGLLIAGIIFSFARGLDYESASILSIMLLALLPCRNEFYRKGSLLHERFSFPWVISIISVIVCSVWLGMFSYKHVSYSGSLWWRFAFEEDAPRFLRATTAGAVLVCLFLFTKLVTTSRKVSVTQDTNGIENIEQIVRSSPKTYAWLALLGDKKFIFDDKRKAFIMYAIQGRSWIAAGDPVGSRDSWQDLVWSFRELCDRYDAWPVFYSVDKTNLDLYVELGMTFLKIGEEAEVDIQAFSLEGGAHKGLRYSHNKVLKENCDFSIVVPEEVPSILTELRDISDQWLEQKKTREKKFSLGFFNAEYLSRTPVAVVKRNNRIIAFANMLLGAEKQEMSVDLMRFLPDSPDGIMDYLFTELLLWGKQQDYSRFNFGVAPLSGLEDKPLTPFWTRTCVYIFRYGEHFYNFQGLRQYKDKFHPQWSPKYLASPKGLMLPRILANVASLIGGGLKGVIMK
jgi:phosphatidylglycerol lysyltransferase